VSLIQAGAELLGTSSAIEILHQSQGSEIQY